MIDAIIAYGRKTNSLGELSAAETLHNIAKGLKEIGPPTPALNALMIEAEQKAETIKNKYIDSYEETK